MWYFFFFFFNDTATTEIYTLSLHDALPICQLGVGFGEAVHRGGALARRGGAEGAPHGLAQAVRQVRGAAHGVHARLMARGVAPRFIDGGGAPGGIAARGPAVVGDDQGPHRSEERPV